MAIGQEFIGQSVEKAFGEALEVAVGPRTARGPAGDLARGFGGTRTWKFLVHDLDPGGARIEVDHGDVGKVHQADSLVVFQFHPVVVLGTDPTR